MDRHCCCNTLSSPNSTHPSIKRITITKPCFPQLWWNSLLHKPLKFQRSKLNHGPALAVINMEKAKKAEVKEDKPRFRWSEYGANITEEQKQAISELPPKMTKRCKALMKQIICFSLEKGTLSKLLAAWVKSTKPRRADWLAVLKQLNIMEHPLHLEVAELALLEESFEANIRDYTKLIHGYGKQNKVRDAENTLLAMKRRGFICDQVTLTAMVHMYSKTGNLRSAEETFEDIKLLGRPLDKRSYGSMITAYVRAGMPEKGENLLREMDAKEIYAGSEVYKALLRAYSMIGDCEGAQRVFDAIQLAGIVPDARVCGLLINAYQIAGQGQKAYITFQNMRKARVRPTDKCVALVLTAYEKEGEIDKALDFLMDLERDRIMIGKEASSILAAWFKRLGVVEEVESVLKEHEVRGANRKMLKF